jgi:hypothetical protein
MQINYSGKEHSDSLSAWTETKVSLPHKVHNPDSFQFSFS